jgi:orotate phosphoribosyltransferase
LIVARPAILRRLGRFLAAQVPQGTDRIAAPTLGAVALGAAVSLETGLPFAIVRSHSASGSRGLPVEGGLSRGETVCLVEDVVVTGTRAAAAVRQLRDVGAEVASVISVIDCERDGETRLRSLGVAYQPLFRYTALFAAKEEA